MARPGAGRCRPLRGLYGIKGGLRSQGCALGYSQSPPGEPPARAQLGMTRACCDARSAGVYYPLNEF